MEAEEEVKERERDVGPNTQVNRAEGAKRFADGATKLAMYLPTAVNIGIT